MATQRKLSNTDLPQMEIMDWACIGLVFYVADNVAYADAAWASFHQYVNAFFTNWRHCEEYNGWKYESANWISNDVVLAKNIDDQSSNCYSES